RYKPVAKKVRPTSERMPEEFRVIRNRPGDCLDSMPSLPSRPPVWEPHTTHLTRERMAGFALDANGFLWPEEIKLFEYLIDYHQEAFAWTEQERRRFRSDYVPPIRYPVVPHEPWEEKNRPIPPGIRDELIKLLKEKIAAGVYEPSTSSYRSGWFCVVKKDGKSLRIVHDLQKLNSVTIRDAGTLPSPDEFSENCAGRACIGALDQYSSFD
ncbi:DNA/RNA polymerase, partial [Auricularia subglabra TFB-10046 SS5]